MDGIEFQVLSVSGDTVEFVLFLDGDCFFRDEVCNQKLADRAYRGGWTGTGLIKYQDFK